MANPVSSRRIQGSCHCGNISFKLDWQPEPTEIPARACTCGFCSKHGGVWTSCPSGALSGSVKDPACTSVYAFGTRTADFHVCLTCGVIPIATCVMDGARYAVVNVNTFDGVERSELVVAPTDFDGETTENRLARRKRNWTPEMSGSG